MRRVLKVLALVFLIVGAELMTGAFSHAWSQLTRVYAELVLDAEPSLSLQRFFAGVGSLTAGLMLLLLDIWARVAWRTVVRGERCPKCGGGTERVKRRWNQRALAWVMGQRVTRRKCQECTWTGLMA